MFIDNKVYNVVCMFALVTGITAHCVKKQFHNLIGLDFSLHMLNTFTLLHYTFYIHTQKGL